MVNLPRTIEHTTVTLELGANFIINMIRGRFLCECNKSANARSGFRPMPGGPGPQFLCSS